MIKKIRRKRIVVKHKEIVVVREQKPALDVCPVCRTEFVRSPHSPVEKKKLPPASVSDEHECS